MSYELLMAEMERQGISRNALALKAEISPPDFYNAIKGDRPFYPKWRKRIAEALKVKESDIFSTNTEEKGEKIPIEEQIRLLEQRIIKLEEEMRK